jgi:hypothetical protein
MGRPLDETSEDPALDVHEPGYVRGGSAGPVEDTGIHVSTMEVELDEVPRIARRPPSAEPVPDVRASLRSAEEVERERAAIEAARQLPTPWLAALVGAGALALGAQILTLVVAAVLLLGGSSESTDPRQIDGVEIRDRLGDH